MDDGVTRPTLYALLAVVAVAVYAISKEERPTRAGGAATPKLRGRITTRIVPSR